MTDPNVNRNRLYAALLLVMLLALAARALPTPRTIDDAFITFRYSRNLVAGEGFVYNPGVQTLGTTTPLYTLLMAGAGALAGRGDYPWYALTVNALADAANAALLLLIVRQITGSLALGVLLGVLWGISPASVTFAIGGMETSVAVLCMLGAFYALLTDRRTLMGACVALGFLTRIDALIWIGPLLLYQLAEVLWTRRTAPWVVRIPWRTWLIAGALVTPWLLFAWAYFGSPLPNSLSAKSVAYTIEPGAAFVRLLQFYPIPFGEYDLLGAAGALLGLALYLPLTLIALIYAAREQRRLLPILLYPWLYMAAFSLANPLIFRWYILPPYPALMLGIVIGLWVLLHALERARPIPRLMPVAAALLACFWGAASLSGWVASPDHGPNRPAPAMAWHLSEINYQRMAVLLREVHNVGPETRIATAEIGVIGYFTRAFIIDTVGLISPDMRGYYPNDPALVADDQNYAIPPQIIHDTEPQFLVTMEGFIRDGLAQEAQFQAYYELIAEIPMAVYGTGMQLYQRRATAE